MQGRPPTGTVSHCKLVTSKKGIMNCSVTELKRPFVRSAILNDKDHLVGAEFVGSDIFALVSKGDSQEKSPRDVM